LILATATLSLVRCTDEPSTPDLALTAADSGQTVELAEGSSLTITLESNATTGFTWEFAVPSESGEAEVVGAPNDTILALDTLRLKASPGLVGAGGQQVWAFEAVGPGSAQIGLEYGQPWDGGIKRGQTFMVTVMVR
jgi:predicted secreted protein